MAMLGASSMIGHNWRPSSLKSSQHLFGIYCRKRRAAIQQDGLNRSYKLTALIVHPFTVQTFKKVLYSSPMERYKRFAEETPRN